MQSSQETKIDVTYKHSFKICLIGDRGAGKTCLRSRYINNKYGIQPDTIGVDLDSKNNLQVDGKAIKIHLWDISGNERFISVTQSYLSKSNAVILVFDLTKRESFNHLNDWLLLLKKHAPECPVVLVGTKSDLVNKYEIEEEEISAFKKMHSIHDYVKTSAKEDVNISEVFDKAAKQALDQKRAEAERASMIDKLNMKHNKKIEELCNLIFLTAKSGQFEIVQFSGWELFKNFIPDEIPKESREAFFQIMAEDKSWPNGDFEITSVKNDIAQVKPKLIDLILELKDDGLRQNLLWQALIPKTSVGSIINIRQSWRVPTLYTSNNKKRIADILYKERANLHLLNSETRKALDEDDVLKEGLKENSPDLYKELTIFLEQSKKPFCVKGIT